MPEPTTAKTTTDPQPLAPRRPTKEAKGRDLGIMAVVGVAVCCGLPVLVGAGTLAAIGGVLRNAWIVVAAVIVVIGVAVFAVRRQRSSSTDACCPPSRASRRDR